jgi:transcriptional regulator with XRE-family HTH domain
MVLSTKDKEDLAIDLINQGYSQREIAKRSNLSFSTIGNIRKKIEGNSNDTNKGSLSTTSQVFKLFEKDKTFVQVVTKLNLPPKDILKIHSDYLMLQK